MFLQPWFLPPARTILVNREKSRKEILSRHFVRRASGTFARCYTFCSSALDCPSLICRLEQLGSGDPWSGPSARIFRRNDGRCRRRAGASTTGWHAARALSGAHAESAPRKLRSRTELGPFYLYQRLRFLR